MMIAAIIVLILAGAAFIGKLVFDLLLRVGAIHEVNEDDGQDNNDLPEQDPSA